MARATPTVEIRAAAPGDAGRLAALFGQLGYPAASAESAARLATLARDPAAAVLVAVADGDVVGAATLYFVPVAHERGRWCRLTALVVDAGHRGRGVGAALVGAAEEAARAAGCTRIEATSANERGDAHRFYGRLGYRREATHFLRRLGAG